MGAVAAAEIGAVDRRGPVRRLQRRGDAIAILHEAGDLAPPLDVQARRRELLDQDALVDVLWEGEDERIGAEAFAEVAEGEPRDGSAVSEDVEFLDLLTGGDDRVNDADLAIELQDTGVHDESARGLAGAVIAVDDADGNPETVQPQRQRQPRRSGADDKNLRIHRLALGRSVPLPGGIVAKSPQRKRARPKPRSRRSPAGGNRARRARVRTRTSTPAACARGCRDSRPWP